MSGRRRPASLILLYFLWRLIAFVAFRRGCFWCETGPLRHTSFAGQRVIDQANRTVGSNPSLSATLRHSSPLYPIVRNCRKTTEELRDSGLTLRASCSFPPWVRRTVLPPLHYSPLYPIVR